jgi:uncharacterized protein YlxW (UPF0749 family)
LLAGRFTRDKNAGTFIHRAHVFVRNFFSMMRILVIAVQITNPAQPFPQSRRNRDANEMGHDASDSSSDKEMSMTEKEQRLAKEREEIAARVASFRATQEKFEREREEYCTKTLKAARSSKTIRLWT